LHLIILRVEVIEQMGIEASAWAYNFLRLRRLRFYHLKFHAKMSFSDKANELVSG